MEGIDVFHSAVDEEKTFRIIHYDIKKQELISVHLLKGTETELIPKLKISFAENNRPNPLSIHLDGSVKVNACCNPEKYIVRATGSITVSKSNSYSYEVFETDLEQIYDQRYTAIYRTNTVITWKDVKKILKKLGPSRLSGNLSEFPVYKYPDTGVRTLANISDELKGEIGEAVTELTVLSLGFIQVASKLPGNKGFDGVFTDPRKEHYIITESKCRVESVSAKKILYDFDVKDIKN